MGTACTGRLLEAPGRDRGGAHADARGLAGAAGIAGDLVLVHGDVHRVQALLQLPTADVGLLQVDQHQVIVGAAGDQLRAVCQQRVGHGLRVGDDLALVLLELRLQRLAQHHGLRGDDVHQGAALGAGEDGGIDLLCDIRVVGQYHAAPGTAQGLVVGGGHHVGIGNRARMLARRDEACDVGDVHHEVGADLLRDLAELLKVDDARIGGSAGDDHPRAVLQGQLAHLVIINEAGNRVTAVGEAVIHLLAWEPLWGCTLAYFTPKRAFARSMQTFSTSSTYSQPP